MIEPSELQITTTELMGARLDQLQRGALAAGVLGLVLTGISILTTGPLVYSSYLFAFLFWLGVTNGALGWLMIHHLVGGGWGYLLRRFLESAAALVPLLLLFFVPVALGLPHLYAWHHPAPELAESLKDKRVYLDPAWFLVRAAVYFAVWSALAYWLNRWSTLQNRSEDPHLESRLSYLAAAGLVAHLLVTTFASVDWVMSLTPRWASSVFGALVFSSQGLTSLAALLVLLAVLAGDRPLLRRVPSGYYRDLGNLLLAALMFWAYLSFSQYLLIYTGNLVEEVRWYVDRSHGGWQWVSLSLIFLHFFLPALVLIVCSRLKRSPVGLGWVAGYVVLMRMVDLFWWVAPTFRERPFLLLSDLGTLLLLGGIWLWCFAAVLRDRPVVPFCDPRLVRAREEAAEHA